MSDAHDHPEHTHPQAPAADERLDTYHQRLQAAVIELLLEKEVFTAEHLRAALDKIDSWQPLLGSRMVARSWLDPEYRHWLLRDGAAAASAMGAVMGGVGGSYLIALENTPTVHNLVVCTLCSCYPRPVLGLPPEWYKSKAYRARAVREPRQVLAEFGTTLAPEVEVRVHDSTADMRYLVVPMRPAGTDGWDLDALAALVTRDCMIGVTVPRPSAA